MYLCLSESRSSWLLREVPAHAGKHDSAFIKTNIQFQKMKTAVEGIGNWELASLMIAKYKEQWEYTLLASWKLSLYWLLFLGIAYLYLPFLDQQCLQIRSICNNNKIHEVAFTFSDPNCSKISFLQIWSLNYSTWWCLLKQKLYRNLGNYTDGEIWVRINTRRMCQE